jgi:formamidopyrimidine-DNA glycosylase
MPELPEVETLVRLLNQGRNGTPSVIGRTITGVELAWPRHIARPGPATFRQKISGRRIEALSRRAKYLVFTLDQGTMLIHLKMTGDLEVVPASAEPGDYDHTVFSLDDDWELRFSDARKFGRVYWLEDPAQVLGKLGPEPLAEDFTPGVLSQQLEGRSRAIKPLLLDQSFVAGIGNIYADEALHRARLHPLHPADKLDEAGVKQLWQGIRHALQQGIDRQGTSLDWVYRGGENQDHLRVYGREGEPCPVCGAEIKRIVVSQRGTHFCPDCQSEGALT